MEKKNEIELLRCSTIETKFDISCGGTAPAENVYCRIEFPEGFKIIEENELKESLREPKEPAMMRTNRLGTWIDTSSNSREVVNLYNYGDSQRADSQGLTISIDSNIIHVQVNTSIPHNSKMSIEGLFARLPNPEIKNLEIKYEIHADNLPFPIKDRKIDVVIER